MTKIETIANAALSGDSLGVRSSCQDFLLEYPVLADCPQPATLDETTLAVAAAIIELLALRNNQKAPTWTASVGALGKPLFLVKHASTMTNLRKLCEEESPEPLRKRGLLAPPNYLEFV